jgi:Protein of unknown function (DUF3168)
MAEGAAAALAASVIAALRQVRGLSGVFDGPPLQAADAHAVLDIGPETDWGHKSGSGAEIRFAVLIRCGGEQADRTRRLVEDMRAALSALEPDLGGWRLVTLVFLRSRIVREPGPRWTGVIDYRAQMLAA